MYTIVLLRHGESTWNKENRFTGWTDVELSPKGIEEAHNAGRRLKSRGFTFNEAFTSVLKRAINTLNIVLVELELQNIKIHKDWHLNERHYGALQGLNKQDMIDKYGIEQVQLWRRSFDIRPPALKRTKNDEPECESLKDTIKRVLPYWNEHIVPCIKNGKKTIISAHGNSLRALIMHLEGLNNKEIVSVEIPTGVPLVYKLNKDLIVSDKYYINEN